METRLTKYQDVEDAVIIDQPEEKKAFILGNTRGIELQNLQDDYLVPVFSRDNVETISHNDFIMLLLIFYSITILKKEAEFIALPP